MLFVMRNVSLRPCRGQDEAAAALMRLEAPRAAAARAFESMQANHTPQTRTTASTRTRNRQRRDTKTEQDELRSHGEMHGRQE